MEDNSKLVDECKRLQENAMYTSTAHFVGASMAHLLYLATGSMPIIFGAIGGSKILQMSAASSDDAKFWALTCTLIAGISGTLLRFWRLAESRDEHKSAAQKFKSIEIRARQAHQIHSSDEDYATFKGRVIGISEEYNTLGEEVLATGELAFWIARWKIGKRVFRTEVDEARDDP